MRGSKNPASEAWKRQTGMVKDTVDEAEGSAWSELYGFRLLWTLAVAEKRWNGRCSGRDWKILRDRWYNGAVTSPLGSVAHLIFGRLMV